MQISPFTIAVETAGKLRTPMASVGILSAVAAAQIDAGLIDDAFITVAKIPSQSDQRSLLINTAINAANNKNPKIIPRLIKKLIELDPESSVIAGRLAQTLLDNNEPETALNIIHSVNNPFDSSRSCCEFAVKLLDFDVAKARGIIETINDVDYRDWGSLELAQRIIKNGEINPAIEIVNHFSSPLRRAWAFFDLGKLTNSATELRLYKMVLSILEAIEIDPKNAESLATALRIIGKSAYNSSTAKNKNTTESENTINEKTITAIGERLLELSEAAAVMISVPVQRLRAKLFLAGTLLELGLIGGAEAYIDRREIVNNDFSTIEQSKAWQWAAECDPKWESDWARAVTAVSIAQRKSEELGLAERTAEIVRRFALRNNKLKPTGKPNDDSINLPARQFEEYYYSPFAIENCNC
ncbi:MAG: hypothetical protein LBT09_09715 [Planctomycetaceae bacterium]|jgi:hypothetical protein|nr:hypothetical protein [Planctomycetaceae bacterium]